MRERESVGGGVYVCVCRGGGGRRRNWGGGGGRRVEASRQIGRQRWTGEKKRR